MQAEVSTASTHVRVHVQHVLVLPCRKNIHSVGSPPWCGGGVCHPSLDRIDEADAQRGRDERGMIAWLSVERGVQRQVNTRGEAEGCVSHTPHTPLSRDKAQLRVSPA